MPRIAMLVALIALPACGDKEDPDQDIEEDDTATTITDSGGGDGTAECEGSAPVITLVTCSNSGMQDNGGTDTPTFTFEAAATDADGDLEDYAVEVFLDGASIGTGTGSTAGGACLVTSATARSTWFVDGAAIAYGTTYEVGMTITDRHGDSSEMATASCTTPNAGGLGGGTN